MAMSEDLFESLLDGSEEVVESPCSICLSRDAKMVESHNFCDHCNGYLCKACTTWHDNFPAMLGHQVMAVLPKAGEVTSGKNVTYLPTERCQEHDDKILDNYCTDHDVVCCVSCVEMDHKSCDGMKYIPKFSKGTCKGGKDFSAIKVATKKFIEELRGMKSAQRDLVEQLDTEEKESLNSLQGEHKRLIKLIEDLTLMGSDKIRIEYQEIRDGIQRDMKEVDRQIDVAEKVRQLLTEVKDDNESELFVCIKQGEKKIEVGKMLLKKLRQSTKIKPPKFKINDKNGKYIGDLKSLGCFTAVDDENDDNNDDDTAITDKLQMEYDLERSSELLNEFKDDNDSEHCDDIKQDEKEIKDGENLLQNLKQPILTKPSKFKVHDKTGMSIRNAKSLRCFDTAVDGDNADSAKTAKLKGEYDVAVRSDVGVSSICGCCLLPDGTLMLADWSNKSLKLLDASYRVKSTLRLPSNPGGICCINLREVAVTLTNERKVQFVSISDSMKMTRSFRIGEVCRGICHSNGELYVCCGSVRNANSGHVCIYSMSGSVLHTIQTNQDGEAIFSIINHIVVTSSQRKFYVTDRTKGVIAMDRNGKILSTYNYSELRNACGICVLGNHQLVISGGQSNNVLHIGMDGRKFAVMLNEQNGLDRPLSLCADSVLNVMVVTSADTNSIRVYDLA